MKKVLSVLLAAVLLAGCTGKRDEMDRCMKLRADLLACESCEFDAAITADYGDAVQTFKLRCAGRSDGTLGFEVLEPESIAGITGRFSAGKGELVFDDVALQFPLLADEQVTPVSAPWILLKSLLGGCLTDCAVEEELLRLRVDDSYEEDALGLDVWLNAEDVPVHAEIQYDGRRILTVAVENFRIR